MVVVVVVVSWTVVEGASVVVEVDVLVVVSLASVVIGTKLAVDGGEAEAPLEQAASTAASTANTRTRRKGTRCIERTVPFRSRNAVVRARLGGSQRRIVFNAAREGVQDGQVGLPV
jgi:hypothetical protein